MPVTKLRLYLHATKLPCTGTLRRPPDTYAQVYILPNLEDSSETTPTCIGTTEVIERSQRPNWVKGFSFQYDDESESKLNFRVVVYGNHPKPHSMTGNALFEVGEILKSHKYTKVRRLRNGGCIFAHLEQRNSILQNNNYITFQIKAIELEFKTNLRRSDPNVFYEIARQCHSSSGVIWNTIYRSNCMLKGLLPVVWSKARVDLETLCDGDLNSRMLISVFLHKKGGNHRLIGLFETSVQNFFDSSSSNNSFLLRVENNPVHKVIGKIMVMESSIISTNGCEDEIQEGNSSERQMNCNLMQDPLQHRSDVIDSPRMVTSLIPFSMSFDDYVKAGLELNMFVAIDFTSSNGDPRIPGTLHYNNPDGTLNDYEQAILSIGNVIETYNTKNEYSVWGFGAKFDGIVRHIFQCGSDRVVEGMNGILEAYKSVFEMDLIMSGPTVFSKVIEAAAKKSLKKDSNLYQYNILLIITDGIVNDVEATQRLLQSINTCPLSIIIIGIGTNTDFSSMQYLEEKSNATFVEFGCDPDSLTKAALENLPSEVVRYFSGMNL